MKRLFENFKKFQLDEEIYGKNAVVYHRTRKLEYIESILLQGFSPGGGDMYGEGLYSVYEFDPHNDYANETYGSYIIKFKVNLANRFLIFDYDEAKKVYGSNYRMEDQFKELGIKVQKKVKRFPENTELTIEIDTITDERQRIFKGKILASDDQYFYYITTHDADGNLLQPKTKARNLIDSIKARAVSEANTHDVSFDAAYLNILHQYATYQSELSRQRTRLDRLKEGAIMYAPMSLIDDPDEQFQSYMLFHFSKKPYTKYVHDDQVISFFKQVDNANIAGRPTSDAAYDFAILDYAAEVNGIVFTGRKDGKVLVGYDPDAFTMLAWASLENPLEEEINISPPEKADQKLINLHPGINPLPWTIGQDKLKNFETEATDFFQIPTYLIKFINSVKFINSDYPYYGYFLSGLLGDMTVLQAVQLALLARNNFMRAFKDLKPNFDELLDDLPNIKLSGGSGVSDDVIQAAAAIDAQHDGWLTSITSWFAEPDGLHMFLSDSLGIRMLKKNAQSSTINWVKDVAGADILRKIRIQKGLSRQLNPQVRRK